MKEEIVAKKKCIAKPRHESTSQKKYNAMHKRL